MQRKKATKIDVPLIKHGGVFLVSSIIIAGLNYLYQILLGRMLTPAEFGLVATAISLINFFSFSSGTLTKIIAKEVSLGNGRIGKKLLLHFSMTIIILSVISLLFLPLIEKGIRMPKEAVFMSLLAGWLFVYFSGLLGMLNGLKKFIQQNIGAIIVSVVKCILGISLIFFLKNSLHGITGILGGIIIGIFALLFFLKNHIGEDNTHKIRYRFAFGTLVSSLLLAGLLTIDIMLVRHFFDDISVGKYTAASTLAKTVWIAGSAFSMVIFPNVSKKKPQIELFTRGLLYTCLLVFAFLLPFIIMPGFITHILIGQKYLVTDGVLSLLATNMGLYTLIMYFTTYDIAIERFNFIPILGAGNIILATGILFFHHNLLTVAKVILGAFSFVLIGLIICNKEVIVG